ncbi:DUF6249 domain-containing protein [uncultured Microbulbifer sp.]|uniref:DUF6249 domain-containing protein n=1 Tax=uncultured Microbulbifer sp. TaxID=348147 RepID=UPI0025E03459|nr:DUF6249 domain-containing protein [uncultured Microbulbifer sp.]
MRARKQQPPGKSCLWATLVVAALGMSGWGAAVAQDDVVPQVPAEAPEAPVPPVPPKAPIVVRDFDKQVRILRQEDGSLRILTRDSEGDNADIRVDLGDEFGGEVTKRIYRQLEEKGILDEKGLVIEEALESIPRNIEFGIAAEEAREHAREMAREQRRLAREARNMARDHKAEVYEYRYSDEKDDDKMEMLIAIVAIIAVFGTPILIVWLVTRNSYRKKQLLMENVNRLVAEGRDIPPELLDAMENESPNKTKDRGFTLIAVGAAIFIWLSAVADIGVGSLGLIPLFIGVARYINWKLDNQQQAG